MKAIVSFRWNTLVHFDFNIALKMYSNMDGTVHVYSVCV